MGFKVKKLDKNTSNKQQFTSQLLDYIQETRCKVKNKPPTSLGFNYVKPCFDLFQFNYNFMTKGYF